MPIGNSFLMEKGPKIGVGVIVIKNGKILLGKRKRCGGKNEQKSRVARACSFYWTDPLK